MAYLRNFGHDGFEKFNGIGINAKNSEFHAGMGLAVIPYLDEIRKKKQHQFLYYKELLKGLDVGYPETSRLENYNYAYFPIIFDDVVLLKKCMHVLEENGIGSRRYFYPALNNIGFNEGICPISDRISERVLCLPLYHSLTKEEQRMVARLLLRVQNNL